MAVASAYENIDGNVSCDTINTTGSVNTTGDLIVGTTNIITEIGTKQDEITTDTDISCKTLTTKELSVNGTCVIDTNIYFDTIVIRRPDPSTADGIINLNEIQVWVNDLNIMVQPTTNPTGYFANWDNKEVVITAILDGNGDERSVDAFMYNYVLETNFASQGEADAMIIKDIPLTSINDIQSIVIYNRGGFQQARAIGLVMELYNKENDFTLSTPLASTSEIEVAERTYRYDFPSITSYTLGFSTAESTTQIRDSGDSDTITEVATINVFETDVNINGNVVIEVNLSVGDVNVITEIGTKQNTIQDGDLTIAKTSGLQTALDNKYDDTGGSITGSVNITGDLVVGTTNIITELGTK